MEPSYEITSQDTKGKDIEGKHVKKSDSNEESQGLSTAEETVIENQSDTVTFKNKNLEPIIVPSGIVTKVLPYIVLIVLAADVIVFIKKRRNA